MKRIARSCFVAAAITGLALTGCGDTGGGAESDMEMADTTAGPDTVSMMAPTGVESEALLNPNEASREELAALPGLDSASVDRIISERPYETMVSLDQMLATTMDSTALDALYRRMFMPIHLNEATPEEIMLIPGVGERMTHEFQEYRPYEAMAEFRREIGKYVDEQEVARLERYVRLQ